MPRRYRKTCLNAYPLRRERSQNFDNNNANPNFWAGIQLPPLLFRETWPYALADPINAANTTGNWALSGSTLHTAPLCQVGNPIGQVNWGEGGFITFPNLWSGSRNVLANQANVSKPWAFQINVISLGIGLAGDGGNNQLWTLGTQNGMQIQNDGGGMKITLYGNAGGVTNVFNRGLGTFSGILTVLVNGTLAKMYLGTTLLGTLAIIAEASSLKSIQCSSSMSDGNIAGTAMVMGFVALYGTNP